MTIADLRRRILPAYAALAWLPPALARLALGWVFAGAGATALAHRAAVAAYFTRLGIPAPAVLGPFVGAVELVGGALLLLGLGVRLASLPLIVIMLVAIATAKRAEVHSVSNLFGLPEFLYAVLGLWLAVHGAGRLSLDTLWTGRRRPRGTLYGGESISAEALDS